MSDLFCIHSISSASDQSKPVLEQVNNQYGFIPNLLGIMAESTPLLQAYLTLSKLFQETTLSVAEKHIVLLTISAANQCHYCLSAHKTMAKKDHVSDEIITCIVSETEIQDKKLEALRRFISSVVQSRGFPDQQIIQQFLNAGYSNKNILEIILGVGLKTMSNYTNHIAQTPIDDVFK